MKEFFMLGGVCIYCFLVFYMVFGFGFIRKCFRYNVIIGLRLRDWGWFCG